MSKRRYGRGTFEAHPNYVKYMQEIVESPEYSGMPNAVSDDGHINWQVSSGQTTSFYKYYLARKEWWQSKCAEEGVPYGPSGKSDAFTIVARRIHPTGYRPCRLCGESYNVGYFYLNQLLANRLNKMVGAPRFHKTQPIDEALQDVEASHLPEFVSLFPERQPAFSQLGVTKAAFEQANSLRTGWLSPGFMGNPPDRLDGFHDYCLVCRPLKDPGRSALNLRSYNHDRRAFEWWSEGDWFMADALYNSAGAGTCSICGQEADPVSPDHIGPLACGFKQLPLFAAVCPPCNSSKNRRMTLADVRALSAYEERTGESSTGWYVRAVWDANKHCISSDAEAVELSTVMRSIVDVYLRSLESLRVHGHTRFLATLLSPECAFFDHVFIGLDPSTFDFDKVESLPVNTPLRVSLANRSMRIAFEELQSYAAKPPTARRLRAPIVEAGLKMLPSILEFADALPQSPQDVEWNAAVRPGRQPAEIEAAIGNLRPSLQSTAADSELLTLMDASFVSLGAAIRVC